MLERVHAMSLVIFQKKKGGGGGGGVVRLFGVRAVKQMNTVSGDNSLES